MTDRVCLFCPPMDAPGTEALSPLPPPGARRILPDLQITAYGTPAPQGSKIPRPIYRGRGAEKTFTGHVALAEAQGDRLTYWRNQVVKEAADAMRGRSPLDGWLRLQCIFTMGKKPVKRPTWWPAGEEFSRHFWFEPAGPPDLDKLIRAVGDALKIGGAVADDAKFTRFRDSGKVYCGDPDEPDAMDRAGAVIRVWRVGARRPEGWVPAA